MKETRVPRPARPGAVAAYDYEYERNKERIVLVMDNPVSWYGAGSEHPSSGLVV